MNDKTLRILEYDKITAQLSALCVSEGGRARVASMKPQTDIHVITQLLEETGAAEGVLFFVGSSPVSAFEDIVPPVQRSMLGSTLSMGELLKVAAFMHTARKIRKELEKENENATCISRMAENIQTFRPLEEELYRCIISPDEMHDGASGILADIRRKMRRNNEKIKEKLNSYLRKPELVKLLQDPIITVRGDRYVIPVKAENKGSVSGIVHDQSATGATLFIEPMAVVELNNEQRILTGQEKEEIERILALFSGQVAQIGDALVANHVLLVELDFIFARAKLSRNMKAISPRLNQNRYINIKNGRHPLLDPKAAVPISVWLGDAFTVLLITGPNTGGKTVTLKTIGLFQLMAQSGLHVPCDAGSELTVFDKIFADIGDEQSIEQSLSTFSSHMTNIANIMDTCDGNSLVLFDELGAGTDPNEGASLAMSILERLIFLGTRTVATTHYSELKAYSLTTQGIENASVEFDAKTLRPTYKLAVGVPGASNAFLISKRLGLQQNIIDRAVELMSGEQIRFESVLQKAEQHRRLAQQENEKAVLLRRETEHLKNETDRMRAELRAQEELILEKARKSAKRILENADVEAKQYIDELKQLREGCNDEALIKMQTKRKAMREGLTEQQGISPETDTNRIRDKEIVPGLTVYVASLAQNAIVQTTPNAKGEVRVQAGILQMNVKLADLFAAKQTPEDKKKTRVRVQKSAVSVPLSMDVRGKTVEEAMLEVDRYLEEAAYAGYGEVTVIHGKGTGALRAGIMQELKKHNKVKGMRSGRYGEGDNGVTVIQLK